MAKEKKLKKFLTFGGSGLFVILMVAVFLTPAVPLTCGKALGHYPVLMEALTACEASKKALGSDIHASTIGLNTGSCSGGSDQWRASGRMPVTGSKGKGTLRYVMSKSGDKWSIHAMTLSVNGETVDVWSCLKNKQGAR